MKYTNIDDYIERVAEKYDKIPKDVIKKVIEYGFRSYYRINLMGGDVLLKSPYFTAYTGKHFRPDMGYEFGKYRGIKKRIKYRIQYARKQTKYSGYYYFGMTEDQYKAYKEYFGKTGRRNEKVRFENITLYKILNEILDMQYYDRFFRVEIPDEGGYRMKIDVLETKNFDYIGKKVNKKFISVDYEKRKQ